MQLVAFMLLAMSVGGRQKQTRRPLPKRASWTAEAANEASWTAEVGSAGRCAHDSALLQHNAQVWSSSLSPHSPCIPQAACTIGPYGRLGNRLYMLGALLQDAAQYNLCYVSTRGIEDATLEGILRLPETIHVASGRGAAAGAGEVPCAHTCSVVGDCGRFRRGHQFILRGDMQRILHANKHRLRCNTSSADNLALGPAGIVLHMRSGDIMTSSATSGYYPQPPCSYYSHLARHGNAGEAFEHVLIVTESDQRNPCIDYVRNSSRATVTVQSRNISEDACALAQARNLAISMGTWGPALASLSLRLRNLHVPFGTENGTTYAGRFDGLDSNWYREAVAEEGLPEVVQHVHSFPGYNTTWENWDDRVRKMFGYQEASIVSRVIPAFGNLQQVTE